jgi:Tfp pilus assembly protein PilF
MSLKMRRLKLFLCLGGVFALKLLVVLHLRDHPLLQPDAGLDTTAYVSLAQRVVTGDVGLGPGLYFVSPLYIYFLAACLAVSDSFLVVRVVQIALGTAAVGFVFLTAREWFGERAAWMAAALATLTGLFTFYEALLLQSALDPFLTSAALLALTFGLRAHRHEWLALAGGLFGIQTLNRPQVLMAVAGLAAVLAMSRRIAACTMLLAGLLVAILPVAARNVLVSNQWSLLSSHGGLNFYIGNGPGATGFYRQIPGVRPTIQGQEVDVRRVAEAAAGRALTDAEVSAHFYDRAWSAVLADPVEAAVLFARKLGFVLSAQHVALPHSYPFYAHDGRTALRFLVIGPWLLVPLGLVGLVVAAPHSRRTEYLIWVSFVPFYAAAVAAFFVAERYRLPLLVPLAVGAGAAIDWIMRQRAAANRRALVAAAGALALLLALVNWPHGLSDGRWEEGLRLAQRLVILGRYGEADEWARKIQPREPHRGATDYGVGAQLLLADQFERARVYLARAQEADPHEPAVEYALGQALLKSGRAQEALPHLRRGFEAGIELPLGGYDFALALHTVGDLGGAADVIRRIRPGDREDVEAWLRLGRLATRSRAPELADGFFRRAVELRPNQASVRQQYGLNLLVLGRYDEAAGELAEAVRLDPRDPDSLAHLAYCEFRLGRFADARAHSSAALALDATQALAVQLARQLPR